MLDRTLELEVQIVADLALIYQIHCAKTTFVHRPYCIPDRKHGSAHIRSMLTPPAS